MNASKVTRRGFMALASGLLVPEPERIKVFSFMPRVQDALWVKKYTGPLPGVKYMVFAQSWVEYNQENAELIYEHVLNRPFDFVEYFTKTPVLISTAEVAMAMAALQAREEIYLKTGYNW